MTRAAALRPPVARIVKAAAVAGLLAAFTFLLFVGRFLAREDPLERADLIMVLGGARIERWLESVDLYKEGWAPRIVISPGQTSPLDSVLAERGVRYPREGDLARDAVVALGVPANAVTVLPNGVDNTAAEAALLHRIYPTGSIRRIIVVTTSYHLRRAGYAFRRELSGAGVQVIMRGSRYDQTTPSRWWTHRNDIRYILSEVPKFAAYVAGLGE